MMHLPNAHGNLSNFTPPPTTKCLATFLNLKHWKSKSVGRRHGLSAYASVIGNCISSSLTEEHFPVQTNETHVIHNSRNRLAVRPSSLRDRSSLQSPALPSPSVGRPPEPSGPLHRVGVLLRRLRLGLGRLAEAASWLLCPQSHRSIMPAG